MPTIKTSSIALVSLPIMVLLATIGWVYPHLPSHWWHPVSIDLFLAVFCLAAAPPFEKDSSELSQLTDWVSQPIY